MSGCEYNPNSNRLVSRSKPPVDCVHADIEIIVRFLDLIKPFTPLLPEVAAPETKTPFNQKLMWTGVSIFTAL